MTANQEHKHPPPLSLGHKSTPPPSRHLTELKTNVAIAILRELARQRIDTVFTVPGGPLMPFLYACRAEHFKTITCRHETGAAIMAATYYHVVRRPAVLALTAGPGAANAANGITHALREQAALFVVSARPSCANAGRGAVQDFDASRFFATITKQSEQLYHPEQVVHLTRALASLSVSPDPGPVNLTIPSNLWHLTLTEH